MYYNDINDITSISDIELNKVIWLDELIQAILVSSSETAKPHPFIESIQTLLPDNTKSIELVWYYNYIYNLPIVFINGYLLILSLLSIMISAPDAVAT